MKGNLIWCISNFRSAYRKYKEFKKSNSNQVTYDCGPFPWQPTRPPLQRVLCRCSRVQDSVKMNYTASLLGRGRVKMKGKYLHGNECFITYMFNKIVTTIYIKVQ